MMVTQMQTDNTMHNFVKVIDPVLSKHLIESGFSYIKEDKLFAFYETPELIIFLKNNFSGAKFFTDNKLRF